MTWRLKGWDAFSDEWYPITEISGAKPQYDNEAEARADGQLRLAKLEQSQPTSSSGGQAPGGIQDRVYLVHPNGTLERLLPSA